MKNNIIVTVFQIKTYREMLQSICTSFKPCSSQHPGATGATCAHILTWFLDIKYFTQFTWTIQLLYKKKSTYWVYITILNILFFVVSLFPVLLCFISFSHCVLYLFYCWCNHPSLLSGFPLRSACCMVFSLFLSLHTADFLMTGLMEDTMLGKFQIKYFRGRLALLYTLKEGLDFPPVTRQ